MRKLVVLSLLLSVSAAQLHETRQARSPTRRRQQTSPRRPDGYISLKKLNALTDFDNQDNYLRMFHKVPTSR